MERKRRETERQWATVINEQKETMDEQRNEIIKVKRERDGLVAKVLS